MVKRDWLIQSPINGIANFKKWAELEIYGEYKVEYLTEQQLENLLFSAHFFLFNVDTPITPIRCV